MDGNKTQQNYVIILRSVQFSSLRSSLPLPKTCNRFFGDWAHISSRRHCFFVRPPAGRSHGSHDVDVIYHATIRVVISSNSSSIVLGDIRAS